MNFKISIKIWLKYVIWGLIYNKPLFVQITHSWRTVTSFTKEVNPQLAKRPLKTNGRLANRGLTNLVKEATGNRSLSEATIVMLLRFLNKPDEESTRDHVAVEVRLLFMSGQALSQLE